MYERGSNAELEERIIWLIRLRWIAVFGLAATVYIVHNVFGLNVPVLPLYLISALLAAHNILFFTIYCFRKGTVPFLNRTANIQISIDLLILALLIHFSGGVENPFIFYFIFHVIIAGILLSRRAAFLQATFCVFLFLSVSFGEYTGALRHYCIKGFIPYTLHRDMFYILGLSFVFISTVYIAAYMAVSISKKLKERGESLRKANALLNDKDRIKSEYVLRVTHDIKEHLAAIQSCIDPVVCGITGGLNEKQKDLLNRAKNRAQKLLDFVKSLLEITRLKLRKELKIEKFPISGLISAAEDDIGARASLKGVKFSTDIEKGLDTVKGVRVYIEEAVMGLLANAVKYTPRGGSVLLSLRKGENGSIIIEVRDTGMGIPKDALPKVFDEFYRAENAKKIERNGTGMGLSIAREIMDMHGGRIWVESEEGRGSAFYMQLPA